MSHPTVVPPPASGNHPETDPVAISLGFVLGRAPAGARRMMYTWRETGLVIIEQFLHRGERERLSRFLAPLLELTASPGVEQFTATVECEIQRKDLDEDIAQAEYRANPTPENKARFLEKSKRDRDALTRQIAALEATP